MSLTIVVLGMHRSGTSCVTRMLNLCGMHLGTGLLDGPVISNMEGKWEAREAVRINERILALSGGAWDHVPPSLRVDPETESDMLAFLAGLSVAPVCGWKDPRTVLTFLAWRPLLDRYRIAACFRHPVNVARSLGAREGWPLDRGLALWLAYNEALLRHTEAEQEVVWFDFDRPIEELDRSLRRACRVFALEHRCSAAQTFNRFQRHHDEQELPGDRQIREVYRELVRRAQAASEPSDASTGGPPVESATGPDLQSPADRIAQLERGLVDLARIVRSQNELEQGYNATLRQVHWRVEALETTSALHAANSAELAARQHRLQSIEASLSELAAEFAQCRRQCDDVQGRIEQIHGALNDHSIQIAELNSTVQRGLFRRVASRLLQFLAPVLGARTGRRKQLGVSAPKEPAQSRHAA